jgi:hypothetical protein
MDLNLLIENFKCGCPKAWPCFRKCLIYRQLRLLVAEFFFFGGKQRLNALTAKAVMRR